MSLSNSTLTALLPSFMSAKGDTEPGITPKKFSNLSELPKDSRLPPNFCPSTFKSILRSSLQTTSHISVFFARKNRFLQCKPGKSPLNFLESSTVNSGGCSCVVVLIFSCSKRSKTILGLTSCDVVFPAHFFYHRLPLFISLPSLSTIVISTFRRKKFLATIFNQYLQC